MFAIHAVSAPLAIIRRCKIACTPPACLTPAPAMRSNFTTHVPHACALNACHVQRLAQLPDAEFTTAPGPPAQQALLGGPAAALALPPCLKVKWLRADCLSALDVRRPGAAWTTAAWQSLAFCMHAIPQLEELRVRLPCDAPVATPCDACSPGDGGMGERTATGDAPTLAAGEDVNALSWQGGVAGRCDEMRRRIGELACAAPSDIAARSPLLEQLRQEEARCDCTTHAPCPDCARGHAFGSTQRRSGTSVLRCSTAAGRPGRCMPDSAAQCPTARERCAVPNSPRALRRATCPLAHICPDHLPLFTVWCTFVVYHHL